MIYLVHKNNAVQEILNNEFAVLDFPLKNSIAETLFSVGEEFPKEFIIWCHADLKNNLNRKALIDIFHHNGILASYSISKEHFIPNEIGYVDQAIFIKVNKKVTYPTWLMSSNVGGLHASVLNKVLKDVVRDSDFDYFINSISKLGMPQGLFCYSEPRLLLNSLNTSKTKQGSRRQLFKFVRQHYKSTWLYFLFFCFVFFERSFPLFPFLSAMRFRRRKLNLDFDQINIKSSKKIITQNDVDVIIPTLGRKKYLYDVLKDLANQTLLPKNVIIVEQNPNINSKSELDYLTKNKWPFNIKHLFIQKLGVCNARNLALEQVESEWTFFGDDDIRFNKNLLSDAMNNIEKYGVKAVNTVCLQPNEKQSYFKTSQTSIFGSGTSVVNSGLFKSIKFDQSFEFGFGEDSDFGMQIRNLGEDVVFISKIIITHLKAPLGGFRSKMVQLWDNELIKPKPSPTVTLYNLKYLTNSQILGYKLLLFITYYRSQRIKNPITYFKRFQKKWESSLYWANQLTKDNA